MHLDALGGDALQRQVGRHLIKVRNDHAAESVCCGPRTRCVGSNHAEIEQHRLAVDVKEEIGLRTLADTCTNVANARHRA
jgi:hypothetical protein